jgi:hypothetical protein
LLQATDLLVLPDDDHPEVEVYRDELGRWTLDRTGTLELVGDRITVPTTIGTFVVELPLTVEETGEQTAQPAHIERAVFHFRHSSDEEHVEIEVADGASALHVPYRSHHYLLLLLARARQGDAAAGVPPAEAGWVHREDLERMLRVDRNFVNVAICRARKQLSDVGIAGAARIVERRSSTGQVRLGTERLRIEAMA